MRTHARLVLLVTLVGGCALAHERTGDASLLPMDAPFTPPETGRDAPFFGGDAPSVVDGSFTCSDVRPGSGTPGDHCAAATCSPGASCALASCGTIQATFGLRTGVASSPTHPGYAEAEMPNDPADEAPFNGLSGTLCLSACDRSNPACGAGRTCSAVLTQAPLLVSLDGAANVVAGRPFGADTGICRIDCAWSATARSPECPDDSFACDSFDGVCVEACTTDNECNTEAGVTFEGELVTLIERAHPAHCNHVTGRCEHTGTPGATVGTRCTSSDDCAPGVGVCLPGGICAELGCPESDTGTCGADYNGICLSTTASSRRQSICILGCDTSADCPSGNNCIVPGPNIGRFSGYCIDACSRDGDCRSSDVCQTRAGVPSKSPLARRCAPRCSVMGAIGPSAGCAAGEACVAAGETSAGLACAPIDSFCGAADAFRLAAASDQCATGYVCDELVIGGTHAAVADGRCVQACSSDAVCAAGARCVTSGDYAGLCRAHCSLDSECPSGEVCDRSQGWCVEARAGM